jgi:hypothetical protein
VLRTGRIPPFVHGVIEYAAGVLFIAAPFLFGFDSDAARAVSIVLGVALLVVAAATEGPTGLANVIPTRLHVVIDFGLAALLIAAPFLFSFTEDDGATAFFIVLGVVHLLLTIGTRFLEPRPA